MSLSADPEGCQANGWCRIHQITGGVIRPGGLDLTERALAFCSLLPGATVLDVGCGPGATLDYLLNHDLVAIGVDLSVPFLRLGRQRNLGLSFAQAMGERLPLASGTMDAVLAECSLSVIEQADRALDEFFRVLKPGGRLIISDLYLRQPEGIPGLRRLPLAGCIAGAQSRQELASRLGARGFRVLLWEDHSAAYRQMAAQLIMAGGSPEQLWCPASCADMRPDPEVRRAISVAKPGYFLLVAERQNLALMS